MHACDLAASHIGNLEVRMEEELATERQLFTRIVHSYVEVQFLLP